VLVVVKEVDESKKRELEEYGIKMELEEDKEARECARTG
jgi:hypothetical protein